MSHEVNPYASPQASDPYAPRVELTPALHRPYQSAAARSWIACAAETFLFFCHLLLLGSFALQISMLVAAQQTGALDQQGAEANDIRQQGVAILCLIAAIASLITLLAWIYAANRNLASLRPTGRLEFTPGWSVGWFFVPIANLVKPYQAVREIWEHSDPKGLDVGFRPRPSSGAALVGWWWGLRLSSAILGQLLSMGAAQNATLEGLLLVSWIAVGLTVALDMPLAICHILMIRRIQTNQDERQRLISESSFTTPPASGTSENPFAHLA